MLPMWIFLIFYPSFQKSLTYFFLSLGEYLIHWSCCACWLKIPSLGQIENVSFKVSMYLGTFCMQPCQHPWNPVLLHSSETLTLLSVDGQTADDIGWCSAWRDSEKFAWSKFRPPMLYFCFGQNQYLRIICLSWLKNSLSPESIIIIYYKL